MRFLAWEKASFRAECVDTQILFCSIAVVPNNFQFVLWCRYRKWRLEWFLRGIPDSSAIQNIFLKESTRLVENLLIVSPKFAILRGMSVAISSKMDSPRARGAESATTSTDGLFELAYDELRDIARGMMFHEKIGNTLSATALVNEAYLRLGKARWDSRGHFFHVGSRGDASDSDRPRSLQVH
ncbi:MAG: ECF-type sigma factor [Pirellulaceae bacterium]